jgi:CubicO group peptidase (beta-lactamase class C family)
MRQSTWSAAGLRRLHTVMEGHIQQGTMPGAITLVSRRGEVHVDVLGTKAIGGSAPMQRSTIFRIASMTKPIAAVATLILVEECKLRLDEPVDPFLPELANRQVLKRLDGPITETVPAERPISVRDLLTMCMGFGAVMAPPDTLPIQRAMAEADLAPGPPKPVHGRTTGEWIASLSTLPLMAQPGTAWLYPTSFSVLGVLIARASGQPLETFLRERIFGPLGMTDTGFSVPASKVERLATSYVGSFGPDPHAVHDGRAESAWLQPTSFPDADGGLVSTVDDYLAFGTMMLNGGKLGNERIISRLSVEVMTTDQLTASQRAGAGWEPGNSRGWGFGVSVVKQRDDISAVPGRYGWEGGLGTSWATDRAEGLIGIMMTQAGGFPNGIYNDFWTSVYAAIDD